MTKARCLLVREIEELAAQSHQDDEGFDALRLIDHINARVVVDSEHWPRIRAALEAGDEMADFIDTYSCECDGRGECKPCDMIARFRAATRKP